MSQSLDRRTAELVDAFMAGQIIRRAFISRMLATGLTASVAGSVLAFTTRVSSALAR